MAIALDNTIPIQTRGSEVRGAHPSAGVARIRTTHLTTGHVRPRRVVTNALAFAGSALYFGVIAPLSQLAKALDWSGRRLERFRLFL
jgi:hypothetical protein